MIAAQYVPSGHAIAFNPENAPPDGEHVIRLVGQIPGHGPADHKDSAEFSLEFAYENANGDWVTATTQPQAAVPGATGNSGTYTQWAVLNLVD